MRLLMVILRAEYRLACLQQRRHSPKIEAFMGPVL